jgi:hypothetical protein
MAIDNLCWAISELRSAHRRASGRGLDVGGAHDRGFGAGELEETVLCKLSTTSR